MKYLIFISLITLINCQNYKPDTQNSSVLNINDITVENHFYRDTIWDKPITVNDSLLEDKLIEKVITLPEVKILDQYLRKKTNGERNVKIWLPGNRPTLDSFSSIIFVGEDNGLAYHCIWRFDVVHKNRKVNFIDIMNDEKIISLHEWRNSKDYEKLFIEMKTEINK